MSKVLRNKASLVAIMEFVILLTVVAYYSTLTPNRPPTANAGNTIRTLAGFPVELDGSGSRDPDGDELTYYWSIISKPEESEAMLSNPHEMNPKFTPDRVGVYNISLIVYDGLSYSSPSTVIVIADPWFRDITDEAGVGNPPSPAEAQFSNAWLGYGAAWGDYDNDGDLDLYVAYTGTNILYRNNGDGTFTDVAVEAGVDYHGNTYGVVWGDYDNDGDLDLYLANYGNSSKLDDCGEANVLYRNNGDGTFTDVTAEAGVGDSGHSTGAAWGDYDNDGDLDLFVANLGILIHPFYKNETSRLYRNNGNGTFTDVTLELNLTVGVEGIFKTGRLPVRAGCYFTPLWFDCDLDGDLDLFITTAYFSVSPLYLNDGPPNYTFTEVTKEAGLWRFGSGMGAAVGDYDNDGDLDLYVAGFEENRLWRNNGDGTFTDVAKETGVIGLEVGWGCAFFDFDNDGDLDLFVANGAVDWKASTEVGRERWSRNRLYRNNGDGTFTDVTKLAIGDHISNSKGLAVGDFDNDGDLDIYIVNVNDINVLLRNDIANFIGNNWIKVKLQGILSNKDGIGAIVGITSGSLIQIRQVLSESSYLSQNSLDVEFGLANHPVVDRIEVRWPSGIVQVLTNVEVNQTITITEASSERGGFFEE